MQRNSGKHSIDRLQCIKINVAIQTINQTTSSSIAAISVSSLIRNLLAIKIRIFFLSEFNRRRNSRIYFRLIFSTMSKMSSMLSFGGDADAKMDKPMCECLSNAHHLIECVAKRPIFETKSAIFFERVDYKFRIELVA